jgi:ribosomal protein L7Ae-like RNA K-turn-binding protein
MDAAGSAPERALLDLLGLAARARAFVHGTDATRRGVRDGEVAGVLLAADTSPTQSKKLLPLLQARGVPHAVCLTRAEMGAAAGLGPLAALGFTDRNFARRALALAAALDHPQDSV